MIAGLTDLGKTVFLTTHYMDEAQHLADRVAILRHGELVAVGDLAEIGAGTGAHTVIRFRVPEGGHGDDVRARRRRECLRAQRGRSRAIGPFSAVILSFISSVFVPIDQLPGWLQEIGRVFTLSTWPKGCRSPWGSPAVPGSAPATSPCSPCGRSAAIVGARAFKWEPQTARG